MRAWVTLRKGPSRVSGPPLRPGRALWTLWPDSLGGLMTGRVSRRPSGLAESTPAYQPVKTCPAPPPRLAESPGGNASGCAAFRGAQSSGGCAGGGSSRTLTRVSCLCSTPPPNAPPPPELFRQGTDGGMLLHLLCAHAPGALYHPCQYAPSRHRNPRESAVFISGRNWSMYIKYRAPAPGGASRAVRVRRRGPLTRRIRPFVGQYVCQSVQVSFVCRCIRISHERDP